MLNHMLEFILGPAIFFRYTWLLEPDTYQVTKGNVFKGGEKNRSLKDHVPSLLYTSELFWFITSHCDYDKFRVHFVESVSWNTQVLPFES